MLGTNKAAERSSSSHWSPKARRQIDLQHPTLELQKLLGIPCWHCNSVPGILDLHMACAVKEKLEPLSELCRKHQVNRLILFGSALREDFDPKRSDLDFLVEFQPLAPGQYAKAYFGLLHDMESLFGLHVDLVESGTVQNPYILKSINVGQEILYAA